jgi:Arc/MetJ-type ribon-helix-helix transcriptional regulator
MPIVICVELSEKSKAELDELVQQGSYRGYSEAVSVAISNQLVLQRRIGGAGTFVLDDRESSGLFASREVESQAAPSAPLPPRAQAGVPSVFSLAVAQDCQIEPAPLPDDVFSKGSKVSVDRWFFGQHNKLLPVKATCRALAVLLVERRLGISISDAGPRIAREAAGLGDYLRQLDVRSGAIREEALATAFPSMSEDSDKSRLRYANQFMANINTQSQLSGLLVDLKLINHVRGKEPLLLLTEPGLQFAKLYNPILDEPMRSNGMPRPKFSDEEVRFLLNHIKDYVPVEDFAFRTILSALKAGINTPEAMDENLAALLPTGKKKVSDAFVTTQRSGVISRMSDLDMVLRRRDGIRVQYEATPRGHSYLSGVDHEK